MGCRAREFGQGKAPRLQTFVVQYEATALPVQQFNVRTAPVDKHKYVTAARLATELIANDTAQSIEGLAHVTMPPVQVVAKGVAQCKHRLPQGNELGNTGLIVCGKYNAYPVGVDNLGQTGIFGAKWNKSTGTISVGFLILSHPVLECGELDVVLGAKRFLVQTGFLPPGDQVKVIGLLGSLHRFLPTSYARSSINKRCSWLDAYFAEDYEEIVAPFVERF